MGCGPGPDCTNPVTNPVQTPLESLEEGRVTTAEEQSQRGLQLLQADISKFLFLHLTPHWICLAWPRFVEENKLGFILESSGEILRGEFFRKQ